MKKFFVALVCVVMMVTGCKFTLFNTSPGEDICLQKPPESTSWLCEAAAANGVTLNSVEQLLLDSSAVGVILSDVDLKRVAAFLDKIDRYIEMASLNPMSYNQFLEKLNIDADEAVILKSILSRHLSIFQSDAQIWSYDLYLMKLHIKHQKEQFGLT